MTTAATLVKRPDGLLAPVTVSTITLQSACQARHAIYAAAGTPRQACSAAVVVSAGFLLWPCSSSHSCTPPGPLHSLLLCSPCYPCCSSTCIQLNLCLPGLFPRFSQQLPLLLNALLCKLQLLSVQCALLGLLLLLLLLKAQQQALYPCLPCICLFVSILKLLYFGLQKVPSKNNCIRERMIAELPTCMSATNTQSANWEPHPGMLP